jgi:hypothetical protein
MISMVGSLYAYTLWSVQSLSYKFINIPGKAQFREGAEPPYKTISLFFFQREKEEALNEMDAIRDRLEITQVSISRNFFFFVTGGETIS